MDITAVETYLLLHGFIRKKTFTKNSVWRTPTTNRLIVIVTRTLGEIDGVKSQTFALGINIYLRHPDFPEYFKNQFPEDVKQIINNPQK